MLMTYDSMGQNRTYKYFSELQYDMVKLYQFNGETEFDFIAHNMLCDTSLIDVQDNWAHSVSKENKLISRKDITELFSVIKIFGKDKSTGDPKGCYIPRVSIVFFKKDDVIAHIDVCLECNKFMLEIFERNLKGKKIKFYIEPSTMGNKTRIFFKKMFVKYGVS